MRHEIRIGNTDFVVDTEKRVVHEWGVNRHYSPDTKRGWQVDVDGQHIGLCSYAGFGEDMNQARQLAQGWRERAQQAWDEVAS